jgi:hypothetical protein
MPTQKWTPAFSDADPDSKTFTFFELLPQNFYIKVERAATSHTASAPIVTISVSKLGNSDIDTNTINEGNPALFLSGNTCNGYSANDARPSRCHRYMAKQSVRLIRGALLY